MRPLGGEPTCIAASEHQPNAVLIVYRMERSADHFDAHARGHGTGIRQAVDLGEQFWSDVKAGSDVRQRLARLHGMGRLQLVFCGINHRAGELAEQRIEFLSIREAELRIASELREHQECLRELAAAKGLLDDGPRDGVSAGGICRSYGLCHRNRFHWHCLG